jgi:hypothetical protein
MPTTSTVRSEAVASDGYLVVRVAQAPRSDSGSKPVFFETIIGAVNRVRTEQVVSVASETTKRLKAALETDKQKAQREFVEREREIKATAAKAQRDAEDTARVEEQAQINKKDHLDASRLEGIMSRTAFELSALGSIEDRKLWMEKTGVSVGALARAASAGPIDVYLEIEEPWKDFEAAGVDPPHDRHLAAIAALRSLYLQVVGLEQRQEEARHQEERATALREHADRLIAASTAKYEQDRADTARLEG